MIPSISIPVKIEIKKDTLQEALRRLYYRYALQPWDKMAALNLKCDLDNINEMYKDELIDEDTGETQKVVYIQTIIESSPHLIISIK